MFPPLTKDFFGMKYYGTACGFVMTGVPIGILASNQIFGMFYDQQLELFGVKGVCYGKTCFQNAFIVAAAVQAIALILSIFMFKIRHLR
jgi:hypothetical protein